LQIREKLNVPGDIAETLQHLGSAYGTLGQYDQAMTSYMRSLDLYRKGGDSHGAAVVSHSMGLIFEHQGRLGPAVDALQDAVKAFQALGDRSSVTVDALNDLADALAQAGRGSESGKLLEESKKLARDLKNDSLQATVFNTEGNVRFYQGDLKSAKDFYQQALHLAVHAADKDAILTSRLNLARVAVTEGDSHSAISPSTIGDLRSLVQQADAQGSKYISVACSVLLGEAMIKDKDYSHARQELQRSLARSEKLGLRMESARIHYLLGTSLRLSGSAGEAAAQYREARNLLDEIRKEQGAEHTIERYDLKPIYADASQFAPQN
jgi:tetratricopeptide (TPR) repeat protein